MSDCPLPSVSKIVLLLDGGLGSELEYRGLPFPSRSLWSSYYLHPPSALEQIQRIHREYLTAGADIITTATYQATFAALAEEFHLDSLESARDVFRNGIFAADRARAEVWNEYKQKETDPGRQYPMVAVSLGNYGAVLGHGEEFTAAYGMLAGDLSGLKEFHRPRVEFTVNDQLSKGKWDLIMFETVPSLVEIRAILELMSEPQLSSVPFIVSVSVRDGPALNDGNPVQLLAQELVSRAQRESGIDCNWFALGVNCSSPENAVSAIRVLQSGVERASSSVKLPRLIAYPNSGERWIDGHWDDSVSQWPDDKFVSVCCDLLSSGASIIGGCCRIRPKHIAAIRKHIDQAKQSQSQ